MQYSIRFSHIVNAPVVDCYYCDTITMHEKYIAKFRCFNTRACPQCGQLLYAGESWKTYGQAYSHINWDRILKVADKKQSKSKREHLIDACKCENITYQNLLRNFYPKKQHLMDFFCRGVMEEIQGGIVQKQNKFTCER